MKIKHLIILLFLLSTGTNAFAAFWQTYICYHLDSAGGASYPYYYLRPEVHYGCYGFGIENITYFLVGMEYEKAEEKDGNFKIFLKVNKISNEEKNELITSILMHGFDNVTMVFKNGKEITYTIRDIDMPFFMPVYFENEDFVCSDFFIRNALELIKIYSEKIELDYKFFIIHIVTKGETLYGISKKYGISQEELIKNNPILKEADLRAGQRLIIYYNSESKVPDRLIYEDSTKNNKNNNTPKNTNILNIVIYVLLAMSVLLNVFLFLKRKK